MKLENWMPLIKSINKVVGLAVMIILANAWSNHLQQIHENDMWFSNIEVSDTNIEGGTQLSGLAKNLAINKKSTILIQSS